MPRLFFVFFSRINDSSRLQQHDKYCISCLFINNYQTYSSQNISSHLSIPFQKHSIPDTPLVKDQPASVSHGLASGKIQGFRPSIKNSRTFNVLQLNDESFWRKIFCFKVTLFDKIYNFVTKKFVVNIVLAKL